MNYNELYHTDQLRQLQRVKSQAQSSFQGVKPKIIFYILVNIFLRTANCSSFPQNVFDLTLLSVVCK